MCVYVSGGIKLLVDVMRGTAPGSTRNGFTAREQGICAVISSAGLAEQSANGRSPESDRARCMQ